jgi:hypothetical protein
MTKEQVIETLKQFNAWRRGAEIEQPNPELIGKAIDEAINRIEHPDSEIINEHYFNAIKSVEEK